ncbi:GNAT family N-acetyltransferase [Saccharopolyspora sp. TS4A08]|uniref:GNAT family N-acetyltransferase n=1 Tax=Saccharopolyspora ipomoeae TaxID=3042027 RepID=A0ABT6PHB1_9PSEU|nr:GNAT family N-acetyltransferase [Saccharopolyspora sp. TS4A08]MDI2027381.1 GNAT family N-acetyltransferase [Saccharopolyspora sp. TS4A08]
MRVFLETERMVLRELTAEDTDAVFRLNSDPEVMRYLNGGVPSTLEEVRSETMPMYLARYERYGGHGNWVAVERETGEFLGLFKFHPNASDDLGNFELGYRLHRSAWGRGLATEGSRALIHKGFADLGLSRVWAQTMTVNTGSRRVMEKAGLRYVRTFFTTWPEGPIPGSEHGDVEYALTRDQLSPKP